ncbi:condensation domain-containing protein, partial [Acinetobacter baumannii]
SAKQAQQSLNLINGPLIQVVLFTQENHLPILFIAIHHLMMDGISWRIFLEDLSLAYQERLLGNTPILPPVSALLEQWVSAL